MKNSGQRLLINIFDFWLGKRQFVKLFEYLHIFSLLGLNIGGGSNLKNSGEIVAIRYINDKTSKAGKLVIFDVGANVGDYTNYILELLKDRDIIMHSFEPSRASFNKMKIKIKNKNVELHNFGFGEKNKTAILFRDSDESELASVYNRRLDHFNIKMDLKEKITLKTVDSFCTKNGINRINFLKLDVEGSELNVLKGARDMINNDKIDFIQFEFGGCNLDSRTFFQDFYYLLNKKYKIYRILKNGLYPISQYKETQEIFITTNYLAERVN